MEGKKDEEEPVKEGEVKKNDEKRDKNGNIVISELKTEHVEKVWNSGSWFNWVGVSLNKGVSIDKKNLKISKKVYQALWNRKKDWGKNKKFKNFSGIEIFPSTANGTETGGALKKIKVGDMIGK